MGKIYRDGIIYAGGGNVKECTLAQYNEWKTNGQLVKGVTYNIIDAPNLNETASEISYDGTTTSVKDKIDAMIPEIKDITVTTNNNGVVDSNTIVTGGIPTDSYYVVCALVKNNLYICTLGYYNGRYLFCVRDRDTFNAIGSVTIDMRIVLMRA